MSGLCQCGCGRPAPIATTTSKKYGCVKGQPRRFVSGHNARVQPCKPRSPDRYVYKLRDEFSGSVLEHVIVAARALGKPLPAGAVVHHVNSDRSDNRGANLVICQDAAYHVLLHLRARALRACGHADWLKCYHCGEWGADVIRAQRGRRSAGLHTFYHVACERRRQREQERRKRAAAPRHPCECGCGTLVPQRFAPGHQFRSPEVMTAKRNGQRRANAARVAHIPEPNPSGLCLCGCGLRTALATDTDLRRGILRGRPVRFLWGHNRRGRVV